MMTKYNDDTLLLPRLPEAVFFDVGHTIIFPSPSIGETYAAVADDYGISVDPEAANKRFLHAWKARKTREGLFYGCTHEDALMFWEKIVGDVLREHRDGERYTPAVTRDLYERFSRGGQWRVDPAFRPLAERLRRRGVKIAFVSNWDLRLRRVLSELELIDCADALAISAEVAAEKPDPRLFQYALDQIGVTPEATLHVGDTWDEDVEGARSLGMMTAWLKAGDLPCPPSCDGTLVLAELKQVGDLFD